MRNESTKMRARMLVGMFMRLGSFFLCRHGGYGSRRTGAAPLEGGEDRSGLAPRPRVHLEGGRHGRDGDDVVLGKDARDRFHDGGVGDATREERLDGNLVSCVQ